MLVLDFQGFAEDFGHVMRVLVKLEYDWVLWDPGTICARIGEEQALVTTGHRLKEGKRAAESLLLSLLCVCAVCFWL